MLKVFNSKAEKNSLDPINGCDLFLDSYNLTCFSIIFFISGISTCLWACKLFLNSPSLFSKSFSMILYSVFLSSFYKVSNFKIRVLFYSNSFDKLLKASKWLFITRRISSLFFFVGWEPFFCICKIFISEFRAGAKSFIVNLAKFIPFVNFFIFKQDLRKFSVNCP